MNKLNKYNWNEYLALMVEALIQEDIDKFRNLFFELHPTDQKDIFVAVDPSLRNSIYQYVSPAEFAEVFQELAPEEQHVYVKELERSYAKDVLQSMFTDDIATFIKQLRHEHALWYLKLLDPLISRQVKELLSYPAESAGALMTKEYIHADPDTDVKSVMELIRQKASSSESIYYIYAVNQQHQLAGVVSLRALLLSEPERLLRDIMSLRVHAVGVHTDREEVAQIMQKYDFDVVPVTDDQGRLAGIITIDDVMDVVEQEINEDFAQMTAFQGPIKLNMTPAEAVKRRLPSLFLLMLFGLATAALIRQFEGTLAQFATIAIFIPLITDVSGNTGSQSLALFVRGLVLGTIRKDNSWNWIGKELKTGIALGLVCGAGITLVSQILTPGSWMLGIILGLSLLISLAAAAFTGAIVPLLIHRWNWNPAFASTPVITTINDLVGLLVYLSLTALSLAYLL